MKKTVTLILLLLVLLQTAFAQQGKDGPKTISVNNIVVNSYTALTVDAAAGSSVLTVTSNSAFSTGDLALIIQMQGATINGTATDSTWGAVTNYNNCGLNEFVQVTGITGSATINLKCPLNNSYTAAGKVQVIRVPRYTTLTINANDTLTCSKWNGATGGIIAVEVAGNTVINTGGAINATGTGFRGGQVQNSASTVGTVNMASTDPDLGAEKGESIAGYQNGYNAFGGMFCRGAPANGGGGGDSHNAAGGGGANGGAITLWTGNGNPDITTSSSYALAWDLEYNGFSKSTSSGGGRGGYTWCTNFNDPYTTAPGNFAWGGDERRIVGGIGGRPLDYATGRLFFGGGGGAGQEDNSFGGNGGNGGGIIYISSYGTVSGSGSIISNGTQGIDAVCPAGQGDPPGGGAGGGTVIVNSTGAISGISIYANGGRGGDQNITTNGAQPDESEGAGGAGGGGYIATSNTGITTLVAGGPNGTSNSIGVTPFLPNGGTSGGNGVVAATTPFCTLQIDSISGPHLVCANSIHIYTINSTCPTATYTWSLPAGWSGSSTTNSITVTAGMTGGTLNVSVSNGGCPLDTAATIAVTPAPVMPVLPKDTAICGAINLTLNAGSTGFSYLWSTGATSTSINVTTPGTYWIQVASACDTLRDTTNILQGQFPTVFLGNDTDYCGSFNRVLNAASTGATYLWSTGDTTSTLAVSAAGTYKVVVTTSCGTVIDSIKLSAAKPPTVNIGRDTTLCDFNSYTLTANTDSTVGSYLWSTGAVTPSIPITKAGTYLVTVSNGCGSASDSVVIAGCLAGYVVPNAFTPGNGDGNGLFGLIRIGDGKLTLLYFRIYNRWGQLIFTTNDDQAKWDGKYNGHPEQLDVYVYVAQYIDSVGVTRLLKGNVTLLR